MLRMAISYHKRQAAKALAFTSDELYTRLMQELDKAKIFVHSQSIAATSTSLSSGAALPATIPNEKKKEETTIPPSNTEKKKT